MLDKIGFYTLSEERARTASAFTPLMRCEMVITEKCNFRCPYCRGLKGDANRTLTGSEIKNGLSYWIQDGLNNVRFSGGEPTLHINLLDAVKQCKLGGVKRIAISTNGFMPQKKYDDLLCAGVNDFSISLDACCSSIGDMMAGGRKGAWKRVIETIRYLGYDNYVTVGIVVTDENIGQLVDTILFAHDLGVSDIRVIPAAQYTRDNTKELEKIPFDILCAHPILYYRVQRAILGHSVRGISKVDSRKCGLVLDDSVIAGGYHYPCVIYLREGGRYIGRVGGGMRTDRLKWHLTHDTHKDAICRNNCLDVCIEYNNQWESYHGN
jgi:sulfatase maturation enzyme AslB (radical SAM superfamily)